MTMSYVCNKEGCYKGNVPYLAHICLRIENKQIFNDKKVVVVDLLLLLLLLSLGFQQFFIHITKVSVIM